MLRICQKCNRVFSPEEMTTLGGAEICLDCFKEESRDEETYREYLDDFIEKHRRDFVWWFFVGQDFKADYGKPGMTDEDKTDLLWASILNWKRFHGDEYHQAEIDYSEATPGEWEDYLKGM